MCLRSRLTASPPFCPAFRASASENSWAVPCLWAARPPSAAIARCRWSLIPAKPRLLLDARRERLPAGEDRPERLVAVLCGRVRDFVERDFVVRDLLIEDFFDRDRWLFVSPFSRRILFTVRAATSSARRPYRPDFFALCLMCWYCRSRFGLAPLGMAFLLSLDGNATSL
jgi:hypothetical protein